MTPSAESVAHALYEEWERDIPCGLTHPDPCGGDACLIARWARSLDEERERAPEYSTVVILETLLGIVQEEIARNEPDLLPLIDRIRARVVTP